MTKMNSGEKTKYYKHVQFYSYISLDQSSREKKQQKNKIHLPAAVAQGLRVRVQIYTLPGTEASFSKDLE